MQIAPGIHSLSQKMGGYVHAFLLDDGRDLTLIDTLYDVDGGRVLEYIRRLGRPATDLKTVILTHSHRSHLGGLAALKRASGATVCANEREADVIAGERRSQSVPLLPQRPFKSWFPLQVGQALGVGAHPPCAVDRCVKDGDQVGPLQILLTPGHSPGHLAFYWQEKKALFTGDTIVTWPELAPGWPAFNLNRCASRQSLIRMAKLDIDIVGVGHGNPILARGQAVVRAMVSRAVG